MFQDNPLIGVLIAVVFVSFCIALVLYFVRNLISQEKILFLLIFLIVLLAATWFADNVILFNVVLLDDEENRTILQIITNIVSLVLGYYFGSKKTEDKN